MHCKNEPWYAGSLQQLIDSLHNVANREPRLLTKKVYWLWDVDPENATCGFVISTTRTDQDELATIICSPEHLENDEEKQVDE